MAAHTRTYSEEAALSLVMAMASSSSRPLLLLDGDLNIVAASGSFCDAFEINPATTTGRPMTSLGNGEWDIPQLRSLLAATLSGAAKIAAYELDLVRPGRRTHNLIIHAQRLVYMDLENRRLLVAVCDVTDARADEKLKDEATQRNLVLLQEVRHRVANSLQIIASVLLQNAKRTASEETRGHLKDAHNRVMSVAALERQLTWSGDGHVEVRAYFSNLCDSIAASMIADSDQLSLRVFGAGGIVEARVSVSLGLIVTELVINALKHAFPDHRRGSIVVDCDFRSPDWVLSVTDDGVGMPQDSSQTRKGLGTSIVQALASQLQATVKSVSANPGTRVAIIHAGEAAPVDRTPADEPAAPRPAK